jgi:amino acid transporter
MLTTAKRMVVGRPLDSDAAGHATLPKRLALPIFCSDPLSSVAYATQEILLVLAIGGAAALTLTPWVGLAVVFLLVVVVASYSKTVYAYPGGGGAYAVSKENLGQTPALVAAAALIVDYILTVSVSVTSGVSNLVSAFPDLAPHTLGICIGIVVI